MNHIQINGNGIVDQSKELTDSQIDTFLKSPREDKITLLEMWAPGWRSYRSWTISSTNLPWDGLGGTLEGDPKPLPIADIPENWQEIVINSPR